MLRRAPGVSFVGSSFMFLRGLLFLLECLFSATLWRTLFAARGASISFLRVVFGILGYLVHG